MQPQFKLQPFEIIAEPLQPRLALDHPMLGEIIGASRLEAFRRADHLERNLTQYCEQWLAPRDGLENFGQLSVSSSSAFLSWLELRALAPHRLTLELVEQFLAMRSKRADYLPLNIA